MFITGVSAHLLLVVLCYERDNILRRKSLFHLMRHLDKVLANSKDDKVTADKLAISIGPSLRWENIAIANFHF